MADVKGRNSSSVNTEGGVGGRVCSCSKLDVGMVSRLLGRDSIERGCKLRASRIAAAGKQGNVNIQSIR